ncbi:MAG TPA: FAD-dependent oxidoreductase, partial [Polyangiaceae bacterium LLY-WYZ-14_1]|nr:FAD-dependent oxidoreductase [Polyangiaceae bacterium LLY-WYZ-14_1]
MRPLDAEGVEAGRDGPSAATPPHVHDVVIIGAGFAGLCAAIRMRQDGWRDVVVLEASDRLGGT